MLVLELISVNTHVGFSLFWHNVLIQQNRRSTGLGMRMRISLLRISLMMHMNWQGRKHDPAGIVWKVCAHCKASQTTSTFLKDTYLRFCPFP